jgi:hypothetical protein
VRQFQCTWDVTGTQEPAPATACYETATFNDNMYLGCNGNTRTSTSNRVLGTATSNDAHVIDVTGTQDPAPTTACYETATFNDATCTWDVTGTQEPAPTTACYETTFNDNMYLM